MGAYSRWALIRGWALNRINTVYIYIYIYFFFFFWRGGGGGGLKGNGIFRKEIPGYRALNLYFLKYNVGLLINIKDVKSEKMIKSIYKCVCLYFSVKSWPFKTVCPTKTLPPSPLRVLLICCCCPGARFGPGRIS